MDCMKLQMRLQGEILRIQNSIAYKQDLSRNGPCIAGLSLCLKNICSFVFELMTQCHLMSILSYNTRCSNMAKTEKLANLL